MNVVTLVGTLARPAQLRVLESGSRLVTLEVSVAGADGPSESVPVTWWDPPARAAELDLGEAVVVLGRVRRRFFRTGGVTQSRTDVLAEDVMPLRFKKRARALVDRALDRLDDEVERGALGCAAGSK